MKKYIIDEVKLKEFYRGYLELTCLEWAGVDNWDGYMTNYKDFMREMVESSGDEYDFDKCGGWDGFDYLAEDALKYFTVYED